MHGKYCCNALEKNKLCYVIKSKFLVSIFCGLPIEIRKRVEPAGIFLPQKRDK